MKTTMMLITTHRGVSDETYEGVIASQPAIVVKVKGQSCIDRARSIAFDQAYEAFRQHAFLDMILAVDDDMVFGTKEAQAIVEQARKLQHPVAGLACNAEGKLAGRQLLTSDRWLTGIAFMAIPRDPFLLLGAGLPKLGGIRVWCRTGPNKFMPDDWGGEDQYFCSHFGGVILSDVSVGHIKPMVLRLNKQ